ncbi:hypothetical protein CP978_04860 [Streptomyces nodosus]|uniref:Uncharacterized protein n=2 Tax=Streptomyces nodosus TaxID=40318 RepID=A0A0B5DDX8_9ACTN|nr:hypothetical protein SNOD_04485 [Streptomyces nodosus]QEV43097.1 hypothetical protein CP978_04860 [Streptomyces nodosus]
MQCDALGIYLNDHLAGSTAGQLLSHRLAEHHRSSPYGGELRRVADGIAEDRRTLLGLMDALGVPARHHKVYAGRLAVTARLLKLNGRVIRRPGLSTVIELETLRLGIEGKTLLWRTLREVAQDRAELDEARLEELLHRAHEQADVVESLRRRTASAVFHRPRRRTPSG